MSDRVTPPAFADLLRQILTEYRTSGTVFHIRPVAQKRPPVEFLGRPLESLVGPAAGPHSQFAGNIIAAYVAGARFFELKTVQALDGAELPVAKPCIYAPDECYNVEGFTEPTVAQAQEEYIKAWFILHLLCRELELGEPDGFQFNISVGYSLEGVRSQKMDDFIEGMKDAASLPIWATCQETALKYISFFHHVDEDDIRRIPSQICNSVTVSTLHGCPPDEIRSIAEHLLRNKHLNTFIKCNPTLLGYEAARKTLDELQYDYLSFDEHHFREELQMVDALQMFRYLQRVAQQENLTFGVKLSGAMPVNIDAGQLPGDEMYMSGRALFPLTIQLARHLANSFEGELPISYCGGVDVHNVGQLAESGLRPLTLATPLLKPGGYQRLSQLAELAAEARLPEGPTPLLVSRLADDMRHDPYYRHPARTGAPIRKKGAPPIFDCFFAPCQNACPVGQDVPAYLQAMAKGDLKAAARIVLERNPLPHITGAICSHRCMNSCSRKDLDHPVNIRGCKLEAAAVAEQVIHEFLPRQELDRAAAVIGGGPAGLAAAAFLRRAGWRVTLFEKKEQCGGVVRQTIPGFRIADEVIEADVKLVEALGVELRYGQRIDSLSSLWYDYDAVILAIGAGGHQYLPLAQGQSLNAVDFMTRVKRGAELDLGSNICVVGGGNSAMDAARLAKRLPGVEQVSIIYRRDRHNMPADGEELALAEAEGIRFLPLLAPLSLANARLTCEVMRLGAPEGSGRRSVESTGELRNIPCHTVIAATGEKADITFFKQLGISLNKNGWPRLDDNLQSMTDNVYVIGDASFGPSTVAEAIADAWKAVAAITDYRFEERQEALEEPTTRRGVVLPEPECASETAAHCLRCEKSCGLCVEVCPNRANRLVQVGGRPQVIHFDDLCNACGNCALFCPYEGAPYLDKLTVFSSEEAFNDSENPGVVQVGGNRYLMRYQNQIKEFVWDSQIQPTLEELLNAMYPHF